MRKTTTLNTSMNEPKKKPRGPMKWRDDVGGLLLTVPGACRELKYGKDKVYELVARGELLAIKEGSAMRIVRASLQTYIAAKLQAAE